MYPKNSNSVGRFKHKMTGQLVRNADKEMRIIKYGPMLSMVCNDPAFLSNIQFFLF